MNGCVMESCVIGVECGCGCVCFVLLVVGEFLCVEGFLLCKIMFVCGEVLWWVSFHGFRVPALGLVREFLFELRCVGTVVVKF